MTGKLRAVVACPVPHEHLKVTESESVPFMVLKEAHHVYSFNKALDMSVNALKDQKWLGVGYFAEVLAKPFGFLF